MNGPSEFKTTRAINSEFGYFELCRITPTMPNRPTHVEDFMCRMDGSSEFQITRAINSELDRDRNPRLKSLLQPWPTATPTICPQPPSSIAILDRSGPPPSPSSSSRALLSCGVHFQTWSDAHPGMPARNPTLCSTSTMNSRAQN